MDKTPFFSIIVPVYNVEPYLHQCVNSVISQSYQNYELILVDDGSPDDCPKLCDEFALNYQNVRVIHKKNGGLADARNAGLRDAEGQYILFLDSDDFWGDNNCLKKIRSRLLERESDILIFGIKKFFPKEKKYINQPQNICDEVLLSHAQDTKYLMQHNIFVACACDKVIRKELIKSYNLSFVKGQLSEDIEWCSRLLLTNPRVDIIGEYFYVYRQQNQNSITANIGRKNLEHISMIIEKYAKIGIEQNDKILLNFLAEQYVLWMTVSTLVSAKEIKRLLKKMKGFWFLIKYNEYPHVRKISKIQIVGFSICRYLLGIYKYLIVKR